MTDETRAVQPLPDIGEVTLSELLTALKTGWQDFRRAPLFGLFFSSVYVVCGLLLSLMGASTFYWTLVLSLGFPLVAPFAAVGLYEVSRRIEEDEPLKWSEVLGVVWRERGRQAPWIGAILVIIFLFWSFFAHMSLALFLGNMTLINISSSWEVFQSPMGAMLIVFEIVTGGIVAFLVYALTVVSLPLLLDKELDFVSAMIISAKTVALNKRTLIIWAMIIAVLLFVAMIPMFLGLLVVLPVLGHATWHIYRRALYFPSS
ncbi:MULTISPECIES: DUF2189 domain-containing protein [Halocynthiibacter]|uniref:DUF2189 domain-containing protein n=1 Tax=Halocynthiibacter halioticoli TaxID=2986804 RepID=A0AAE3J088_9RHOB|nr:MULTISPECIES: DUF2189 domain-containing protein [Halocynthiibacter]MCV6825592.1 DUF2189 domain-containing protein [Halocynthiibacter halioticoli]MCW4058593.1 DUF2189 domain-containing protein [Halocynthiibacter sp. SDUM655004]